MYHLTKLDPEQTDIATMATRLFSNLRTRIPSRRNIDAVPVRTVHNRRSRNQRIEPDSPTSPKDEDQPNRMVYRGNQEAVSFRTVRDRRQSDPRIQPDVPSSPKANDRGTTRLGIHTQQPVDELNFPIDAAPTTVMRPQTYGQESSYYRHSYAALSGENAQLEQATKDKQLDEYKFQNMRLQQQLEANQRSIDGLQDSVQLYQKNLDIVEVSFMRLRPHSIGSENRTGESCPTAPKSGG